MRSRREFRPSAPDVLEARIVLSDLSAGLPATGHATTVAVLASRPHRRRHHPATTPVAPTGTQAGALTVAFGKAMHDVLDDAVARFQRMASDAGVGDISVLVNYVREVQGQLAAQGALVAPLASGQKSRIKIGTANGHPAYLTQADLARLDQAIIPVIRSLSPGSVAAAGAGGHRVSVRDEVGDAMRLINPKKWLNELVQTGAGAFTTAGEKMRDTLVPIARSVGGPVAALAVFTGVTAVAAGSAIAIETGVGVLGGQIGVVTTSGSPSIKFLAKSAGDLSELTNELSDRFQKIKSSGAVNGLIKAAIDLNERLFGALDPVSIPGVSGSHGLGDLANRLQKIGYQNILRQVHDDAGPGDVFGLRAGDGTAVADFGYLDSDPNTPPPDSFDGIIYDQALNQIGSVITTDPDGPGGNPATVDFQFNDAEVDALNALIYYVYSMDENPRDTPAQNVSKPKAVVQFRSPPAQWTQPVTPSPTSGGASPYRAGQTIVYDDDTEKFHNR